ncbi:MAG: YmdB family metallophosphoesterase [Treponema sp.]|jgi:metallophosphoesterase (TIGR00282 family)|nr:YmdB family metallophosphoesterase [Treponema sp.]
MKIFYAAELVGKAGVYAFRKALPELKSRYPCDFLIVCADGATGGNGLGRNHAAYLHKLGANVLTLGECCFFKKDLTENIEKLPYVLRPVNLNPEAPGFGSRVYKAGGEKIAVAVLLGQNGFNRLHGNSPFAMLPSLLERLRQETPYVFVDFHAQASAEKKALFFEADGKCTALIGSHTRVQTADETVLPGGTAVISDAGRTGSCESVGGCEIASRIQEYTSGIPDWTKDAWDKPELQGVYIDINTDGTARSIERVRIEVPAAPEQTSAAQEDNPGDSGDEAALTEIAEDG